MVQYAGSCAGKGAEGVERDIRLYALDVTALEDEAVFGQALACALPGRRLKIDALALAKDRQRSLGAHLLLGWALKEEGTDIARERFDAGENGKPVCLSRPDIYFSLSHSGDVALCALSDAPVGCDAEVIGRVTPAVAKRCFSPEEISAFRGEKDAVGLCRLWTLKESALKCTGRGLSFPMRSLELSLGEDGPELISAPDQGIYDLYEYAFMDCRLAICALRTGKTRKKVSFSCPELANILQRCYNIII